MRLLTLVCGLSSLFGMLLRVEIGFGDDTGDHAVGSLSTDLLNQFLVDEGGSEFDGSFTSHLSTVGSELFRGMGVNSFLGDFDNDLSSDSHQGG